MDGESADHAGSGYLQPLRATATAALNAIVVPGE